MQVIETKGMIVVKYDWRQKRDNQRWAERQAYKFRREARNDRFARERAN